MGHRALVAYEREDGRYDLHYSHWGADGFALAGDITPETPLGGAADAERAEHLRDRLRDLEIEGDGYLTDAPETAVDPRPIATGCSLDAVLDRLEFRHHEAFYVVTADYRVTAYLPVAFGFEETGCIDREHDPGGALVAVRFRDGDPVAVEYLRGWFRGAKDVLGDLCDRGVLSEEEALESLELAVEAWRSDGREVIVHRT